MKIHKFLSVVLYLFVITGCKKNTDNNQPSVDKPNVIADEIIAWVTKTDQSMLIQQQAGTIKFNATNTGIPIVEIDTATTYQAVDGFGYTLTGGSAYLINRMEPAAKASLLNELFGNSSNSIGISYLRVSIGASDLSSTVFSYNDLPVGQTDINLDNFSLAQDLQDVVPVLQAIIAINPSIKILGSPWSSPIWMKDNGSSIGGSLQTQYYSVYAQYFVKYIQAMKARGINITAITPQNEPLHGGNNPSMVMNASQQTTFIKSYLGPAFKNAGITTKIIVWDHNCDNTAYPITIYNDPSANAYVDGAAFHLYAGDISALNSVHNAFPDKNLYFTEQWTSSTGSFDGDFKWHYKNVIIGSLKNWSKVALEWNLANDVNYGPHTIGGCSNCKGALTINGSAVNRNVSYYIIGQVAKFITPGSVRIFSSDGYAFLNVAFKRPDGKKVLVVLNEGNNEINFLVKYKGAFAQVKQPASSVGTYMW